MLKLSIPYWYLMLFSGFLTATVAYISFRSIKRKGAYELTILMTAITCWSILYALELRSTSLSTILLYAKIEYIFIVLIGPCWFFFALSLNSWNNFLKMKYVLVSLILPAIVVASALTNDYFHLLWKKNWLEYVNGAAYFECQYGIVFWFHMGYSYLMILTGTILISYRFFVSVGIWRYRVPLLLVPLFPMLANFIQFIGLNPFEYLDITPFAFSITGLLFLLGMTRNFQLELIPKARESLIENISEGYIITNETGTIVDLNNEAYNITGFTNTTQIQEFLDLRLKGIKIGNEIVNLELNELPNASFVLMKLKQLYWKKRITGRLLTLIDLTQLKQAASELEESERYLKLLDKITWDALSGQNTHEMLQTSADNLSEMFELSSTYINLWDEERKLVIPYAASGQMRGLYSKLDSQTSPGSMTLEVLERGSAIIKNDIYDTANMNAEISLLFPARSIMALPMIAGDMRLGAALVTFDSIHSFSQEEIRRGTQAADHIALSISRTILMQKTQELLEETQNMNENLEQRILERTEQLISANRDLKDQIEERQKAETIIKTRLEIEHLISNLSSRFMDIDHFDIAIMDTLKEVCNITHGSRSYLFILQEDRQVLDNTYEWCSEGVRSEKDNLQNIPVSTLPWWMNQLNERKIIHIADVNDMPIEAATEQEILQAQGIKSLLCMPVTYGLKLSGFIGIDNMDSIGLRPQEDVDLLSIFARLISSALYRKKSQQELEHANLELKSAYDATIEGWARALELREKETLGHSERTVTMSVKFARRLGIKGEQLEHIRRGALLHDIGKMVIPDTILQKPGALTSEERVIIEEHPINSRKILGHIEFLQPAVDIPFSHHEKWDGTGYPNKLKGEEIPLVARLFALVDVWDALSSDRPYHKAFSKEDVIVHIRNGKGTHFDPHLADKFIELITNY